MGKLQSKHACKGRENPEGGSFSLTGPRECDRWSLPTHNIKIKQELCPSELNDTQTLDHHCHLEVLLPPGRRGEREQNQDARQEWVFTLYHFDNSGKVTKEDMSSLMHSIYEAVEASVNHPSSSSAALKVKLVVTPSNTPARHSHTGPNQEVDRKYYGVDENTERRNHYLDLAGIQNHSSRFGDADPGSQVTTAHLRRLVVTGENCCGATVSRGRGLSLLRSLRARAKAAGGDRGGGGKRARLHAPHPALWCHAQAQHPRQHTHSKRSRSRAQDATDSSPSRTQIIQHQATGSGHREAPGSRPTSCVGLVALAKRHEHHHHHDHHHHHHHHHYHPT